MEQESRNMTAVIKNLKNHDVAVLKRIYGDNVAVLQPHGRLIDADALKPYMLNEHYKHRLVYDADEVANAPTVIEAEDGE